jgi:hypothetical protein
MDLTLTMKTKKELKKEKRKKKNKVTKTMAKDNQRREINKINQ